MNTEDHLIAIIIRCQGILSLNQMRRKARHQECGCQICVCEDEYQCHGCGAKNCGNHPVGEIPNPVFLETPYGTAEAALLTTIAAANGVLALLKSDHMNYELTIQMARNIIGAWPPETLTP